MAEDAFKAMLPRRYYDEYGHDEWERLEATLGGELEYEGTIEVLEAYLPERGHVLDAGCGAGRYTVWLAEQGHQVTALDLSTRQCEIAREKVAEHDVADRVVVHRGDLRSLPFSADRFDAVVCTGGPISHVVDADERATAFGELRRVAREAAPTFVSVMSLLAVLQNLVTPEEYRSTIPQLLEDGSYTRELATSILDEPEFVECHFFRAAELEAELAGVGFDVETLVGLEGIATNVGERIDAEEVSESDRVAIGEAVRRLRTDPAVVDWSNHILAVARA